MRAPGVLFDHFVVSCHYLSPFSFSEVDWKTGSDSPPFPCQGLTVAWCLSGPSCWTLLCDLPSSVAEEGRAQSLDVNFSDGRLIPLLWPWEEPALGGSGRTGGRRNPSRPDSSEKKAAAATAAWRGTRWHQRAGADPQPRSSFTGLLVDAAKSLCCTGAMMVNWSTLFFSLFILYWGIASWQRCDCSRWKATGLSHTHTCIHSPPDSPPIQAATWHWAEFPVLSRRSFWLSHF